MEEDEIVRIALTDGTAGVRKFVQDWGLDANGSLPFRGVDVSKISLSGITFDFHVDFSKCTFGKTYFTSCAFAKGATFDHATFNDETFFELQDTHGVLSFKEAVFKHNVRVTRWGGADLLTFRGARFEGGLHSESTGEPILWRYPNFNGAVFVGDLSLENCTLVDAHFSYARFQPPEQPDLQRDRSNFLKTTFADGVDFSHAIFWQMAVFENATFCSSTSFRRTKFYVAPNFHSAKLHQNTQFSRPSEFPELFLDTSSDGAAEAYRTLKLAMNQQHALSEESAFFLLEMRSRARQEGWSKRAMFVTYDVLSVYGQSVRRPFLWLCGITALFGLLYSELTGEKWETFDPQIFALTLSGAVPFVSALHWNEVTPGDVSIFPDEVTGYVQIALVVQAVISAILLFLIGLGLRNLFKIR